MKKLTALLLTLLLVLLPLCGCTTESPQETAEETEEEGYTFSEDVPRRQEDVFTLLLCAAAYDGEGKTQLTSLTLLTRAEDGTLSLLTIPKDTRVWLTRYREDGSVRYSTYGSIGRTYALSAQDEAGIKNTLESVSRLLGGIRIDRYMLVNTVQLESLAALCEEGIWMNVEEDLSQVGLSMGYQDISPSIADYAGFSYLNRTDVVYSGTDQAKLARHQTLIRTLIRIYSDQLRGKTEEERLEAAEQIRCCPMTDLTSEELLRILGEESPVFEEDALLPGMQQAVHNDEYWITDESEIRAWVLEHFYAVG